MGKEILVFGKPRGEMREIAVALVVEGDKLREEAIQVFDLKKLIIKKREDRKRIRKEAIQVFDLLDAIPLASVGTLLTDEVTRIAVSLRLGLPIPLSMWIFGRFSPHSEINSVISRALRTANFPSILGAAHFCLSGGISVFGGRANAFSGTPSRSAAKGRKVRRSAWQLGTLLQDLSKKLRETTGDSGARVFLRQNISLAVQRSNAASVIATADEGEKLRFCGRW
ncbi:hypothetical protein ACOME3_001665 [Neoechinorhynchus agilis]